MERGHIPMQQSMLTFKKYLKLVNTKGYNIKTIRLLQDEKIDKFMFNYD